MRLEGTSMLSTSIYNMKEEQNISVSIILVILTLNCPI